MDEYYYTRNCFEDLMYFLLWARSGKATFAQDERLTKLGKAGYWDIFVAGEEPCEPYVAHGGFTVDRKSIFMSRLTEAGEKLLYELLKTEQAPRGSYFNPRTYPCTHQVTYGCEICDVPRLRPL